MSYALLLEVMVEVGNIDMITEVMVHVERYQIPYMPLSVCGAVSVPVSVLFEITSASITCELYIFFFCSSDAFSLLYLDYLF